MTLLELIVAMIVIAVASVGTGIAIWNAWTQLDRQRWRMSANQILRGEVERWLAYIHNWPVTAWNRGPSQWEEVVLDERGPGSDDDLIAEVRREAVIGVDENPGDAYNPEYYRVLVRIRYMEPDLAFNGTGPTPVELQLEGYMLRSNLGSEAASEGGGEEG